MKHLAQQQQGNNQETLTRSQRVKHYSRNLTSISGDQKQQMVQNKLNEMESDFYESIISTEQSCSEFEETESEADKKIISYKTKKQIQKAKGKKKSKKTRKDRKATLNKSRLNLSKVINESYKRGFVQKHSIELNCVQPETAFSGIKVCSICCLKASYNCPRCLDAFCSLRCSNYHKEFVCVHMEINYARK